MARAQHCQVTLGLLDQLQGRNITALTAASPSMQSTEGGDCSLSQQAREPKCAQEAEAKVEMADVADGKDCEEEQAELANLSGPSSPSPASHPEDGPGRQARPSSASVEPAHQEPEAEGGEVQLVLVAERMVAAPVRALAVHHGMFGAYLLMGVGQRVMCGTVEAPRVPGGRWGGECTGHIAGLRPRIDRVAPPLQLRGTVLGITVLSGDQRGTIAVTDDKDGVTFVVFDELERSLK
eukprot:gene16444-19521_t